MKITKRIKRRDEGVNLDKVYTVVEAIALLKERSFVKFDETVEVAFACNIDPRKGEHNIRGMVSLPKGTGKVVRVAVFAQGEQAQKAREAGAEVVGAEDLLEEVQKGKIDFDLCIATPPMMGQLGKLGKILGPKGLMPNPKLGTVTMDVASAVQAAKKGQVVLRAEKQGIVHTLAGKISFSSEDLLENIKAIFDGLLELKPNGIKGNLVKKAYISTTMGFSLMIDVTSGLSYS